jgi:putative ABC transport system permease protein
MIEAVIRVATAAYRMLLFVCPASLRREYGADMATLFRERCARAGELRGVAGVADCAVRGCADLIWGAIVERTHPHDYPGARSTFRGDLMTHVVLQDLRIAVRTYLRQPFFTLTVVATLAIGIGATTAIFGIVDKAVLRPLPYPRSGEIQSVVQSDERFGLIPFAVPYLADFRDRLGQFEALAGFTPSWSLTLRGSGEPRMVTASYVSDGLVELLGATIGYGRNISPQEHASATARVVVVSRTFWEQQFGPGARFDEPLIRLNDVPHVIVGVLRDDLLMPITSSAVSTSRTSAELLLPLSTNELAGVRNVPIMNVVGRLRAGASPARAEAELDAAVADIGREHPALADGGEVRMIALRDLVSLDVRVPLLLLLGAVGGLLLIACANVGNLLLARAVGRTGEMAVRVSLGATRARLAGQMLVESLVLSTAGAALGLSVAWLGLRAFPALGLERLPPSATPAVDWRVAFFAAACGIATAVIIGVVPAMQTSRVAPHAALKEGGRTPAGRGRRARETLVFAEVSVTVVLLIAAGLLARSFWTLTRVESGIRAEQVLAGGVALPAARYPAAAQRWAFVEAALAQLSASRSVERAALVNRLPFGGSNVLVGVEIDGRAAPGAEALAMDRRVVSSDYFDVMGIPVLAGRPFGIEDQSDAEDLAAIVNAAAVRRFWPGSQPLGRRVRLMLRGGPGPWLRIVGIVGDVRHHGLDQPVEPEIYVPYTQAPVESMVFLLRTSGDPLALVPALRETIRGLDPELPLQDAGLAADAIAQSIAEPRMRALIFNVFALVALGLAAIGIYGVISYSVACRTRDIGLRLAFGAQRAGIFAMILREGMSLVVAGTLMGVIGSLILTRLLESQLFGISATDPGTFVAVTGILLLVAFLAHVIPATRAMRLSPVQALRD